MIAQLFVLLQSVAQEQSDESHIAAERARGRVAVQPHDLAIGGGRGRCAVPKPRVQAVFVEEVPLVSGAGTACLPFSDITVSTTPPWTM